MALSWVNSAPLLNSNIGAGATLTGSPAITIPANSLILVSYTTRSGANAISTIADGHSNTYTALTIGAYAGIGRYGHAWAYTTVPILSTDTFTCTFSASGGASVIINAWTGTTSTPADLNYNLSNVAGSTSVSIGATGTLAQADELAVVIAATSNASTFTETSGWTAGGTTSTNAFSHVAWVETAATTALTYTATQSAAGTGYGGAIATFKVAAAGGSAHSLTSMLVGA